MSKSWEFKQSFFTSVSRRTAWEFWSNMQNHAEMEHVKIELDGPFQTGTQGRTITSNLRQEWELNDVVPQKRFVITGRESGFELSFAWDFEDEGTGTRMTQTISANGPDTEMKKWASTLRQMETNAPKGIEKLAAELERLNRNELDSA